MVIQINRHLIYNAYLLPESWQWAGVLDEEPCEALGASLALAYHADFDTSLHGDVNDRTAEKLAYPTDSPRRSMDTGAVTPRGTWLCNTLGDYGLAIANGAICFGPESGKFTALQGKNSSDAAQNCD